MISEEQQRIPSELADANDDWVAATLDDLVHFLDSMHFDEESNVISIARDQYHAVRERRRARKQH